MSLLFSTAQTGIPLILLSDAAAQAKIETLPEPQKAWIQSQGFTGASGQVATMPNDVGGIQAAFAGYGSEKDRARRRFTLGGIRARLPKGDYTLHAELDAETLAQEYLGWLLAGYVYNRYARQQPPAAMLTSPSDATFARRLEIIASGEALTRDLINTPASDMGPSELEAEARALAEANGATIVVTVGEDLLAQNFPMIHTVGRASSRSPRLLDMRWGNAGPSLTLVGKGVCFDTGGLNIKPGNSMGLMKKDMGGAATVLGLARMIMMLDLPIKLRVLIPAVENAISGNAFRPQDILLSRKGLSVEINNTDAEGRLVLADALAFADEEKPDLVISMATLTGAARVAVGPDIAPFYTDNENHAECLNRAGARVADPVWRMPFHDPYEMMIEPGVADLDNAPSGGFAGSITAALFLRRFVTKSAYMHFDIYGWQPSPALARPKGGVGQGARAVLAALPEMLGL